MTEEVTQETTQVDGPTIGVQDIRNVLVVVNHAFKKGAFDVNEATQVLPVYQKFFSFLQQASPELVKDLLPQQPVATTDAVSAPVVEKKKKTK